MLNLTRMAAVNIAHRVISDNMTIWVLATHQGTEHGNKIQIMIKMSHNASASEELQIIFWNNEW